MKMKHYFEELISSAEEENEEKVRSVIDVFNGRLSSNKMSLSSKILGSCQHFVLRLIVQNKYTPAGILKRAIEDYITMGEDLEDRKTAQQKLTQDLTLMVNQRTTLRVLKGITWNIMNVFVGEKCDGKYFKGELESDYLLKPRSIKKLAYAKLVLQKFLIYLKNEQKEHEIIEILSKNAEKDIHNVEVLLMTFIVNPNKEETNIANKEMLSFLLKNSVRFRIWSSNVWLLAEICELQASIFVNYVKHIVSTIHRILQSDDEYWKEVHTVHVEKILLHLFAKSAKLSSSCSQLIVNYFQKLQVSEPQILEKLFTVFPCFVNK